MALSGVRSSCDIEARKRDFARFASSARRRASSDIDLATSSSAIRSSFSDCIDRIWMFERCRRLRHEDEEDQRRRNDCGQSHIAGAAGLERQAGEHQHDRNESEEQGIAQQEGAHRRRGKRNQQHGALVEPEIDLAATIAILKHESCPADAETDLDDQQAAAPVGHFLPRGFPRPWRGARGECRWHGRRASSGPRRRCRGFARDRRRRRLPETGRAAWRWRLAASTST